jgi:parallel beta-helix repeat protein
LDRLAVISNCDIYQTNYHAIHVSQSNDVVIETNNLYNTDFFGIRLSNTNRTLIDGNQIHGNLYDGIYMDNSYDVQVLGNELWGNGGGDCEITVENCPNIYIFGNLLANNTYGTGLEIRYSNYATITGNVISGHAGYGIAIYDCNYSSIEDNMIYDNAYSGILILNSEWCEIYNNEIFNNLFYVGVMCGIEIKSSNNATIDGNEIYHNEMNGISVTLSNDTTIVENHIYDNADHGIDVLNSHHGFINNNNIHGNGFSPVIYNSMCGIYFGLTSNWSIVGNQIWNNTPSGISLESSSEIYIIDNEISNNTDNGIYPASTTDIYIIENIVSDSGKGILLESINSNVTDNLVFDNDIGILIESGWDCWIYGNDFAWNTINAIENHTSPGDNIMWYDNVTETGNHWSDYSGTGAYDIENVSVVVNSDIYPRKSMELEAAEGIEFEITSTGNTLLWPAYALHPSHYLLIIDGYPIWYNVWDGGDIEFSVDGLIAGTHTLTLRVYHYSGHWINASTTVIVVDETPPEWVEVPSDITIYENEQLYYIVNATDPSGIGGFSVNSTLRFAISESGVLTNRSKLAPGKYGVSIIVWDKYDNVVYHVIRVTVLEVPTTTTITTPTTTTPFDPTPLVIGIVAVGGAIVILVVVVFLYKRKK